MKKSKIIIGSSNLNRHFGSVEKKRGFSMLKCCSVEILRVRLASLEDEDQFIVVPVIENLICDEVHGVDVADTENVESRTQRAIETAIEKLVTEIGETSRRLPSTRFKIAALTLRPVHA